MDVCEAKTRPSINLLTCIDHQVILAGVDRLNCCRGKRCADCQLEQLRKFCSVSHGLADDCNVSESSVPPTDHRLAARRTMHSSKACEKPKLLTQSCSAAITSARAGAHCTAATPTRAFTFCLTGHGLDLPFDRRRLQQRLKRVRLQLLARLPCCSQSRPRLLILGPPPLSAEAELIALCIAQVCC